MKMKINVMFVIWVIFIYVFFQMGYDLLYKEFRIHKLIGEILVFIGIVLLVYSQMKKMRKK